VVSLLWRDDLDTAFRHLDLQPTGPAAGMAIQATSAASSVREYDLLATDTLTAGYGCWINPSAEAVARGCAGGTTNR
jgi:hypothetical protein